MDSRVDQYQHYDAPWPVVPVISIKTEKNSKGTNVDIHVQGAQSPEEAVRLWTQTSALMDAAIKAAAEIKAQPEVTQ